MKKYAWLLLFLFFMISGCIPSIYPLYSDDTLTFDENLVGKWWEEAAAENRTSGPKASAQWHFQKTDDQKRYFLSHTSEDGAYSNYEVHLVKLGGNLYFDFYPDSNQKPVESLDDFLQMHLFPVHTFAKASIKNDRIEFRMFDSEWLDDLLEQRKIRIRHETTDGMTLLSASTEELQKFVIKYGDDPAAYVDPVVLVRSE